MYRIPCECGLVYIGETGRNLSVRLKEHKTNCEKAEQDKSAVAKHTWTYDHPVPFLTIYLGGQLPPQGKNLPPQ